MKILVIDDKVEMLDLVREMLGADHELMLVRTIGEVKSAKSYELVIAEYFNPLCPFELVEEYCQKHQSKLVALSAQSERVHRRQLNKPFDHPDLARVIELVEAGLNDFVVDTVETRYLNRNAS